ncbi:hypothetical protein [Bacillus alkalicellulosilyticus]|uniref:hypothetical protein n=1 Tax=Alkalihalobacterium alkalicellulosilyticum TaxID=1912214 RepID=UPI000996DBDB|nr:hypothetical protein [Bacillus alkalicellulosilyticus]
MLKKRFVFLLIGGVSFVTMAIIFLFIVYADNLSVNVNKTVTNEGLRLSIGTLKGSYEVENMTILEDGILQFAYQASVGEGELVLVLDRDGEVILEEDLSPSSSEQFEFLAEKGTYTITLQTEEAKDVTLHIQ